MEVFTLKEWEDNFDDLFARVENGETIGIVGEDGQAAVMMPADEADFIRIHTEDNNDAD
jgi:antitoxin (DNA-binding transcriptional repressor) of toxin-antitoxin stability system